VPQRVKLLGEKRRIDLPARLHSQKWSIQFRPPTKRKEGFDFLFSQAALGKKDRPIGDHRSQGDWGQKRREKKLTPVATLGACHVSGKKKKRHEIAKGGEEARNQATRSPSHRALLLPSHRRGQGRGVLKKNKGSRRPRLVRSRTNHHLWCSNPSRRRGEKKKREVSPAEEKEEGKMKSSPAAPAIS